jgi:hypothetical protein
LTGCATLFAGGPDRVPVLTNPPGAYVYLNGIPVGQTPMELALARGRDAYIQIYLPGFAPVQVVREKEFNGWFIGSIVLFPLIVPLVVDLVTGDYRKFDEGMIALGLTPLAAPAPQWYQNAEPYRPGPINVQPEPPGLPGITVQPATPTSQPPVVTPPTAPPPPKS